MFQEMQLKICDPLKSDSDSDESKVLAEIFFTELYI